MTWNLSHFGAEISHVGEELSPIPDKPPSYDMKAATKKKASQIRLKKIPMTLVGIEPGPPGQ